MSHIVFSYQLVNHKFYDTIYGGHNNQTLESFMIASSIDYFGWITIASKSRKELPFHVKFIAYAHIITIIMAILDFEKFQKLYIQSSHCYIWNYMRGLFTGCDAIFRIYYEFYN